MFFRLALLLAWMLILGIQPAFPALPTTVKVKLLEAYPDVQSVIIQGPFQLLKPHQPLALHGQYRIKAQNGKLALCALPQVSGSSHCIIHTTSLVLRGAGGKSVAIQAENSNRRLSTRWYPGNITVSLNAQRYLTLVNQLPTHTYVSLVVAGETWPGWPQEALKAQAVLTQTRLIRYQSNDLLGDSTQQEVYLGSSHQRHEVDQAVAATWGQILAYKTKPITPFYHASCAGRTSDSHFFQPLKNTPALPGAVCRYCKTAPFFEPTQTVISSKEFERVFSNGAPKVLKRDSAGRPLLLTFNNGEAMTGYEFWLKLGQHFGWGKAPRTRFSVAKLQNGNYQIRSTGAGHGVGLCQWGAAHMAKVGKTYREILSYYFPGTKISK